MPTQEIPRKDWSRFFDVFSRQHEGWLATLEIFGPEVGAQEEAHELPLEGISLASGGNETDAVAISLGKTAAAYHSGDTTVLIEQLKFSKDDVELIRHGIEVLAHWRTSARSSKYIIASL